MNKAMDIIENKYLVAMNRFLDMVTLGIASEPLTLWGDDAEEKWKVEYDIHISGIWRLSKDGEIISAYHDVYTVVDQNGEIVDDEDDIKDETHGRQRTLFEWRAIKAIFPNLPLKVIKASQNEVGDLRLELEKGFCFEAISTYPFEDDEEEWRLIDIAKKKHYVWPEQYEVKVLLVDESNTDLSQFLEMLLREISTDEDFIFKSAGLYPGREISDRVCKTGEQRYGIDIKEVQEITGLEDAGSCDFVVPLGIQLPEKEAEGAERLLIYQEYRSEAKESMEELLAMAARICMAVGCEFQIDDEQRIECKEEMELLIKMQRGVDAFYDRKKEVQQEKDSI